MADFRSTRGLVVGLVALGLVSWPDRLHADTAWIVASVDGPEVTSTYRLGPIDLTVGDSASLVVLVERDGTTLGPVDTYRRGRRERQVDGPFPVGTVVEWYRVVPRLAHVDLEPQNPGNPTFSNNILFGPEHGEWLGFDTLEYTQMSLGSLDAVEPLVVDDVPSSLPVGPALEGAGSAWYAARVVFPDGDEVWTPNVYSTDRLGLVAEVMRVSWRTSDDFLGWLSSYVNVSHVFGSEGTSQDNHQTTRYIGADCADVLVGALRAAGDDVDYTSVAGIRGLADDVTDPLWLSADGVVRDQDGELVALIWGVDVLPGDLLALNFEDDADNQLPRRWDHIGALVGDSDGDGALSAGDILRHMGARGLRDQTLAHFGTLRFRVWRWALD